MGELPRRFWQSWRRQGRRGGGRNHLLQFLVLQHEAIYHLGQPSFFAQAAGERAEKQSEQGEVHLGKFSSYNFVKNPPT